MFALRITTAGRNAAIAANNAGASITINRIAIGTARREPLITHTALGAEVARVPILRSQQISTNTRQLDYEFPGSSNNPGVACNPVGEVGLFLTDGTLFAYWSDTVSVPAAKSTTTTLRGSLFLVLDDLPASAITIQATRFEPLLVSFAGSGGEGDLVVPVGTTRMTGKRRLRNFRLVNGATLIVEKFLQLDCTGEAIFEPGSIVNILEASPGGGNVISSGMVSVTLFGFAMGQNFGSQGGYGTNAFRYPNDLSPVGSGGQAGAINKGDNSVTNTIQTGRAGDGGGCLIVKAQVGFRVGGTINANGGNAVNPVISPNNTGTASTASGSGGGSGGGISLQSPGYAIFDPTFVANLNGGNGSDAVRTTTTTANGGAPGSGGTGGIFEAISPNLPATIAGTINVLGGLSGLFNAGNIATQPGMSSFFPGGTGGAFGNDAVNLSSSSPGGQYRQNSGRIVLLPFLP